MADIQNIFVIAGGLSLILYGIHLSGVNIQKMLGSKLEEVLKRAGSSPFRGMATGAMITGIINSSGTTALILFGLITGGLMTLTAAVPVMLGASIGSTMATQLASLHADVWGFCLLTIGVFIYLFAKKKLIKSLGEAITGWGLIFIGMGLLFSDVRALANDRLFQEIVDALLLRSPLIAVMTGILITLILQSATAASIIAVALGGSACIDLPPALFLILGINLGSSLKVVYLALRGENYSGKLAFIHFLFNCTGFIFAVIAFPYLQEIVQMSANDVSRQIANAHTLYNVVSALIFLPLIPAAVRLSGEVSVRMDPIKKNQMSYLDEKLIFTPSVSLAQVNRGTVEMAKISFDMLDAAKDILYEDKTGNLRQVELGEDKIDTMTGKMTEYAIWISQQYLSQKDKRKLFSLMHVLADLEHLTDHILAVSNILADMKKDGKTEFTEKAKRDLMAVFGKLKIMQNLVIKALEENNPKLAGEINRHENKVDEVIKKVAAAHEKRMEEGVCSSDAARYYTDMLYNLERVGDYYDDIAFAITDSFDDDKEKD